MSQLDEATIDRLCIELAASAIYHGMIGPTATVVGTPEEQISAIADIIEDYLRGDA